MVLVLYRSHRPPVQRGGFQWREEESSRNSRTASYYRARLTGVSSVLDPGPAQAKSEPESWIRAKFELTSRDDD